MNDDRPSLALNRATSFPTEVRRYSSSSTVPLRPVFRSALRRERDVFFDAFELVDGAAVYRVNAVAGIDTSVMTSTLCRLASSP